MENCQTTTTNDLEQYEAMSWTKDRPEVDITRLHAVRSVFEERVAAATFSSAQKE